MYVESSVPHHRTYVYSKGEKRRGERERGYFLYIIGVSREVSFGLLVVSLSLSSWSLVFVVAVGGCGGGSILV